MDEMLSEYAFSIILMHSEDAYSNSSLSDADTGVPNVRRRSSRLGSVKGHPWSDDDEDNNRKKSSTRSVASTDASEYDTTRKSTRMYLLVFYSNIVVVVLFLPKALCLKKVMSPRQKKFFPIQ